MKQVFGFLAIALVFLGCGQEASPGAIMTAPGDLTVTYNPPITAFFFAITAAPLEFQVLQVTGKETAPMPGVTIRFFAGGQVVALTDRSGLVALNPSDPFSFETKTDERGLSPTDVYAVWEVPPCQSDPTDPTKTGKDLSVTGSVTATVGVDSKTWNVNITVKGGTQAQCP